MRAARLLHILLLLQNRGRMTAAALAAETEVAHRTILRDMDALTEAGLPIIAYQGNQGGFELGFNYRTRLTGLAADEAEALSVLFDDVSPRLAELGMADAARRAIGKLRESFPDLVRDRVRLAGERFRCAATRDIASDERVAALAHAVRERLVVRLDARSSAPLTVHPSALVYEEQWALVDQRTGTSIPMAQWRDVNVSGIAFSRR